MNDIRTPSHDVNDDGQLPNILMSKQHFCNLRTPYL